MESVLTIGEVARRSGVATSALRFYEERGLIASERAGSGHRRYPRSVLRRVAFIVFAQRIGLTLEEIGAELAKLPTDRVPKRARLGAAVGRLDRADRRSGSPSCSGCGRADRVHRLRLPVDRPLPPRQPRRPRRRRRGRGRATGSARANCLATAARATARARDIKRAKEMAKAVDGRPGPYTSEDAEPRRARPHPRQGGALRPAEYSGRPRRRRSSSRTHSRPATRATSRMPSHVARARGMTQIAKAAGVSASRSTARSAAMASLG